MYRSLGVKPVHDSETAESVTGLKPEEFLVTVDGKRAEVETIAFLEFGLVPRLDAGGVIADDPQPPAGADSRMLPSRSAGGRVIEVVIDDLSAKPGHNAGLRAAAERILGSVGPSDLIGLVTTSGLGPMVLKPTLSREFDHTDVLRAYFEVARTDTRSTVALDIQVFDADNISQLTHAMVKASGDHGKVDIRIPLNRLGPGPYTLRVTATDSSNVATTETGFVIR